MNLSLRASVMRVKKVTKNKTGGRNISRKGAKKRERREEIRV
jgi:hypothetical protein